MGMNTASVPNTEATDGYVVPPANADKSAGAAGSVDMRDPNFDFGSSLGEAAGVFNQREAEYSNINQQDARDNVTFNQMIGVTGP